MHGGESEIGGDGDGVHRDGRVGPQVSLGVGLVGGADVAALGIEKDEDPCGTTGVDQSGQASHAPPAVALVEGGLRFHHPDRPHRCLDDDVDEALQSVGAVAHAPLDQDVPRGIEAEDERTVLPHGGEGAIGEGRWRP